VNRRQALTKACGILQKNNIEDASLEAEILLRHLLGIDRARLFSDLDNPISPSQTDKLMELVERRRKGEPSAYITGYREFYGLDFKVNRHVLIPRPETELLVEKAINLAGKYHISTIADIGTGCGAIAISLAVHLKKTTIFATDISAAALEAAAENCRRHNVTQRISLLRGDMLEPLPEPVDMIVANLPYVRKSELTADSPLRFEPATALDGGEEGLDKIKALCRRAREKLNDNGILLLEIGQGQGEAVKSIIRNSFPAGLIETSKDLAGIERVVSLRLTQHQRE
jgi:release factor glutamine methyltransferase